ncbi:MAG: YgeY family selenium metabolism-linked hydrolase [bacterium]|nr:YgeY family selenium metabolism-linked hydrolase [bacterium]
MEFGSVVGQSIAEDLSKSVDDSSSGCVEFLRDLVTIPSPTRGERLACERVMHEMEELGYEDVHLDEMGNVLGRVGSGPRVIAYDAHIDTVGITNPTHWKYDPFRGVISEGILYGRGASDQKGGLASIIHGVAAAAKVGIPDDLTLWVIATVHGEDCIGLAWKYMIEEHDFRPEAVVIGMPSHLGVCRGQRGRMELEISTQGVSTHVSHPEHGTNALYSMASILMSLPKLNSSFEKDHPIFGPGSVAATSIGSRSPSLTAVPDECTIHIDRRLTIGEIPADAAAQLETLADVQETNAHVRVLDYDLPSWRGLVFPTHKVFPAWEIPEESHTVQAALATAQAVLERVPRIHRSAFSSNGCITAGQFGIPTIGFGPGDEIHSHTVNDQISLAQLKPAMSFYAAFPHVYLAKSE